MAAIKEPKRPPLWYRAWAVLALLILFAQLLFSAQTNSPTIDEPNHLSRGYAYLRTGDLRMSRDEGHPPLFNLLCALPLALLPQMPAPDVYPGWHSGFRNAFAVELVFAGVVPVERLFFLGRLPVMLATLVLAALAARWAGELYGLWGSAATLLLCVFDPNLIAHGRLVTTDMGITLLFLASVYLFWRFLRRPTLFALLACGMIVGLANSCKFSAVLLFPLLGLLGILDLVSAESGLRRLFRAVRKQRHPSPSWARRGIAGLAVLAAVMGILVVSAGLIVWAVYGFSFGVPVGQQLAVPAPIYVEGLLKTFFHAAEIGHPAFLMGQHSTAGWWYYFPVALALKTPLAALVALGLALLSLGWRRLDRQEWPLLLIPGIYLVLSMQSMLNIGYRHLLPMLPFLWVYVGRLGPWLDWREESGRALWRTAAGGVLTLWLIVGTLLVAPHYLAYFNLLAGGPEGGWRYLVDSNLDWGQDLPALETYLAQHDVPVVYLSWFGSTYPHLYGLDIEYRLLPSHFSYPYPGDAAHSAYNPAFPAPGLYVISATNLQGSGLAAGDVFASFRQRRPVARLGYSLFVYEVPKDTSLSQAPTCISGRGFQDLDAQTASLTLGRGPGAVKWFEHQTGFILPAAGDPAYVLPGLPLEFAPEWREMFLARAQVPYVQEQADRPPVTVYLLDRTAADAWREELVSDLQPLPASVSGAVVFDESAEDRPLDLPVRFDDRLDLVGYRILGSETPAPGGTLELVTVWRVADQMPARDVDLRIFVHLLDDHSRLWSGEDRPDLEPATWESGDLLIQHHRLPLPADTPPGTYQLELGIYTAIRLQRLSIAVDGVSIADRLLLQPVQILPPASKGTE